MRPRPIQVRAVQPRSIWVRFSDQAEGVVDLSHLAGKGVFGAWEQPGFFERVSVSSESGTVTWPGEIDLDPDVLYHAVTGRSLPGSKDRVA